MPRQGDFAGAYDEQVTLSPETGTHTLVEEVTGPKEISEVTLQAESGSADAELQVNGSTVESTTVDTTETVLAPQEPVSSDDTIELSLSNATEDLGTIDTTISLGL